MGRRGGSVSRPALTGYDCGPSAGGPTSKCLPLAPLKCGGVLSEGGAVMGPPSEVIEGVKAGLRAIVHDKDAITDDLVTMTIMSMRSGLNRAHLTGASDDASLSTLIGEAKVVVLPFMDGLVREATEDYCRLSASEQAELWQPIFSWVLYGTQGQSRYAKVLESSPIIAAIIREGGVSCDTERMEIHWDPGSDDDLRCNEDDESSGEPDAEIGASDEAHMMLDRRPHSFYIGSATATPRNTVRTLDDENDDKPAPWPLSLRWRRRTWNTYVGWTDWTLSLPVTWMGSVLWLMLAATTTRYAETVFSMVMVVLCAWRFCVCSTAKEVKTVGALSLGAAVCLGYQLYTWTALAFLLTEAGVVCCLWQPQRWGIAHMNGEVQRAAREATIRSMDGPGETLTPTTVPAHGIGGTPSEGGPGGTPGGSGGPQGGAGGPPLGGYPADHGGPGGPRDGPGGGGPPIGFGPFGGSRGPPGVPGGGGSPGRPPFGLGYPGGPTWPPSPTGGPGGPIDGGGGPWERGPYLQAGWRSSVDPGRRRVALETYWAMRRTSTDVRDFMTNHYSGLKQGDEWSDLWMAAEVVDSEADRAYRSGGLEGVNMMLATSDVMEHMLSRIGARVGLQKTGDREMYHELLWSRPPGDVHVLPCWVVKTAQDSSKALCQQQGRACGGYNGAYGKVRVDSDEEGNKNAVPRRRGRKRKKTDDKAGAGANGEAAAKGAKKGAKTTA